MKCVINYMRMNPFQKSNSIVENVDFRTIFKSSLSFIINYINNLSIKGMLLYNLESYKIMNTPKYKKYHSIRTLNN